MSEHAAHAAVEAAQLSEVAPGVYSYVQPDGTWFINNMGFIAGSSSVVSIDSTSTELRNRAYLEAIASVTASPVRVLVNTHHHADHTHGNCFFADATVVSHAKCRDVMLAAGIPDYSAVFPGVEWGDLQFRAPDVTFEGSMVLHLDDRRIELSDLGFVAHTDGDIVAWLPDCRVLFCGDLVFHGGTPFALFGSVEGTIRAMDVLESYGADVIVPGHGPHFGGADIARVLDEQRSYLRFVQEAAAEGLAAGRSPLEQAPRDRSRPAFSVHGSRATRRQPPRRLPRGGSQRLRIPRRPPGHHGHGRLQRRCAAALSGLEA